MLAQFGKQHIARGIGRGTDLVIQKAKGAYVNTVDGEKYFDLTTGIGVVNTGTVKCAKVTDAFNMLPYKRVLSSNGGQGCSRASSKGIPYISQHCVS